MRDFNLFILLDIDPNAAWSEADFRQRLQDRRYEWAKRVQMPGKRGQEAKHNLDLIPEIEKVAADPAIRTEHARAAKNEKVAAQQERKEAFKERIKLLQAKKYMLLDELKSLEKEFADIYSPQEIRKRISVPVRDDDRPKREKRPVLERTLAREIHDMLEMLGKSDLYDFLELPSRTERQVLQQQAREKYNAAQDNSNKTQEVTLTGKLSGVSLDIFGSDEKREQYDETLRLEAFEALKQNVDAVAAVARQIAPEQMRALLKEARIAGLDPGEAEDTIREHARSKGYAVIIEESAVDDISLMQACGYCDHLNPANQKHCSRCSRLLREPCPKCGKILASGDKACGSCGFPAGNRFYVQLLLHDAGEAESRRDYDGAQRFLERARRSWPSTGKDSLSTELESLSQRVQKGRQEQREVLSTINAAIKERRFYAARELLPKLESVLATQDPRLQERQKQITDAINEAEKRLVAARGSQDEESIVAACREALAICSDSEEARSLLRRIPPKPPLSLRAELVGQGIHLTWQHSSSSSVRYTIVRKSEGRPSNAQDGQQLATVSGQTFDDTEPPVGIPVYYAVYANREGVFSRDGALALHPIMLMQDVTRLQAMVDDGLVKLSWQPPSNVRQVVVRRDNHSHPSSPSSGMQVEVLNKRQAVDSGLENGRRYYYTVFCQFPGARGRLLTTDGVHIEAVPTAPPRPITDLSWNTDAGAGVLRVHLHWTPPDKGSVIIIKARQPTKLPTSSTLPKSELAQYGELLSTNGRGLVDSVKNTGIYFYVPVVVFQGTAYVGEEKKFVSLSDVQDLRVQNLGHTLRMQWRWPDGCQEAVLAYSYQDWPEIGQINTKTETVTRAEYERRGYFDLHNPLPRDHYIAVCAVVDQDGERLVATGAGPGARRRLSLASRLTVRYSVKKTFFGRKYVLELNIRGEGRLPPLLLTRKLITLPMSKQDGDVVLRIKEMDIANETVTLPLPKNASRPQSYAKLFLQEDQMYDHVTIRHPARDQLRLF